MRGHWVAALLISLVSFSAAHAGVCLRLLSLRPAPQSNVRLELRVQFEGIRKIKNQDVQLDAYYTLYEEQKAELNVDEMEFIIGELKKHGRRSWWRLRNLNNDVYALSSGLVQSYYDSHQTQLQAQQVARLADLMGETHHMERLIKRHIAFRGEGLTAEEMVELTRVILNADLKDILLLEAGLETARSTQDILRLAQAAASTQAQDQIFKAFYQSLAFVPSATVQDVEKIMERAFEDEIAIRAAEHLLKHSATSIATKSVVTFIDFFSDLEPRARVAAAYLDRVISGKESVSIGVVAALVKHLNDVNVGDGRRAISRYLQAKGKSLSFSEFRAITDCAKTEDDKDDLRLEFIRAQAKRLTTSELREAQGLMFSPSAKATIQDLLDLSGERGE